MACDRVCHHAAHETAGGQRQWAGHGRWPGRHVGVGAAGCSSGTKDTGAGSDGRPTSQAAETTVARRPASDPGHQRRRGGRAGIDAVVQALRKLPDTKVTVVAPATNQSSTGGKTTPGPLTVTDATTASGYPAKAVAGYPADTIRWAIDDHGIDFTPDLVVSGINFGQNIGPITDISGTVGAARAAAARTSRRWPPARVWATRPPIPTGVTAVLAWVTATVLPWPPARPVASAAAGQPQRSHLHDRLIRGSVTVPWQPTAPAGTRTRSTAPPRPPTRPTTSPPSPTASSPVSTLDPTSTTGTTQSPLIAARCRSPSASVAPGGRPGRRHGRGRRGTRRWRSGGLGAAGGDGADDDGAQ